MSKFTKINIGELPGVRANVVPVFDRAIWQETGRSYSAGNVDPVEINATRLDTGEEYLFDRDRLGRKVAPAPHSFTEWQAWKIA